jgi:2'-5' RNA ligase
METVRTFIAILLPGEIRLALAAARKPFSNQRSTVRWEGTDKLHITLKFLGDIEAQMISQLEAVLRDELRSCPERTVTLTEWGFFPHREAARIVFAAPARSDLRCLDDIAGRVENACASLGMERETRPFHPHVTIGRTKSTLGTALIKRIENTTLQLLFFPCTEIAVMRSVLLPAGSRYETQFTIPLKSQELQ